MKTRTRVSAEIPYPFALFIPAYYHPEGQIFCRFPTFVEPKEKDTLLMKTKCLSLDMLETTFTLSGKDHRVRHQSGR